MATPGGSVNLVHIHRYDGSIGIGAHSVANSGQFGFLARDPLTPRTYLLSSIAPSTADESGVLSRQEGFSLETVQRAACSSDGAWAYVITDHDVYFTLHGASAAKRSALQVRSGDSFLDLQAACSDQRRTAVVLTTDRAATSFAATVLETPDDTGAIGVVWSKSWNEPIAAVAISDNGNFIALGHASGNITVLDRRRSVSWVYGVTDESGVLAIAVDCAGSVTALDSAGVVKRHASGDGSVIWRLLVPITDLAVRAGARSALLAVDDESRTILCCVNRSEREQSASGSYVFLNGRTGDVLWDDRIDSPAIGAAVSADGRFGVISSQSGNAMLLSVNGRGAQRSADPDLAAELLSRAQRSYNNYDFARSVQLLHELFDLDPAHIGSGQLYDDAVWHLRESVLRQTRSATPGSLAKVEETLGIIPADEKLIVRRNALVRLLAESLGREASEHLQEGDLEGAIAKLREALSIDRSQTELRNALRSACDKLALSLIKQADVSFHEERFDEAIEMLERVQELRPGEIAIGQRLDHAKGLQAYATAMRHYIAKRYQEAAFWLRKTLSLLPEHAEAARYLAFAEKFGRAQVHEDDALAAAGTIGAISERFQSITMLDLDDGPAAGARARPVRLTASAPDRFALDLDAAAPAPPQTAEEPIAAAPVPAQPTPAEPVANGAGADIQTATTIADEESAPRSEPSAQPALANEGRSGSAPRRAPSASPRTPQPAPAGAGRHPTLPAFPTLPPTASQPGGRRGPTAPPSATPPAGGPTGHNSPGIEEGWN